MFGGDDEDGSGRSDDDAGVDGFGGCRCKLDGNEGEERRREAKGSTGAWVQRERTVGMLIVGDELERREGVNVVGNLNLSAGSDGLDELAMLGTADVAHHAVQHRRGLGSHKQEQGQHGDRR